MTLPADPRNEKDFFLLPPLRQAQLIMLRLLKIFDIICKKHDLTYWLDAGTLLGAARHDGFIPWDDDVDVAMPVADYEKFISLARSELPRDIFFQTNETDPHNDKPWIKLRDCYSYMEEEGGPYEYHQGIFIDIFPMYIQTHRQFKFRWLYSVLPPFNNPPDKPSKRFSFKHNLHNLCQFFLQNLFLLLLKIPGVKRKFSAWGAADKTRGYTYNPVLPWYQFFPPETIFPVSAIRFEGFEFSAPADTNHYLTIYFGDWQTPPPEHKREGHKLRGIYAAQTGPIEHFAYLKWNKSNE